MPVELLDEQIRRLSEFEAPPAEPIISLYLNAQANERGRHSFEPFLRKELNALVQTLVRTYDQRSETRANLERDVQRIETFLAQQLDPAANSVAIFACAGADDFFETVQLKAPLEDHELYVDTVPHLYTLARLNDQFRRYAVAVVNSNWASIRVFGLGEALTAKEVENVKTNRTRAGGWSQARYQRHIDNFQLQHAKEVAEVLGRVATQENIDEIVLAGEETTLQLLREQLSPALTAKVIDVVNMDVNAPEHEVMQLTMEAMRRSDSKTDAEAVERVIGDYRAHGLAAVGSEQVLAALERGQVDEVLLTASPQNLSATDEPNGNNSTSPEQKAAVELADEIVRKAALTAAAVRFIEDANLLAGVGGVGARLRYRL